MNLRDPKLWLAAISLVIVTFLVIIDLGNTSPGPLSRAHAAVEGLDESTCDRCHGEGEATLADACNECHEPIAEQLLGKSGFHGFLDEGADCGHCHVEHVGTELPLVDDHTFALAGFEPRSSYGHEGLAFELSGRHDGLDCIECHSLADVQVLAVGEQRFLGASQDCVGCHDDPHEGRMVEGCSNCHGQDRPFSDIDGFVHSADFPLTGVHANPACADCHAPQSPYAVVALGGIEAPPARGCAACHDSTHSEPFLSAVAAQAELARDMTCAACHTPQLELFAQFDAEAMASLHSASGFDLTDPHGQLECTDCHDPRAGEQRYLGRRAEDCAACHESPHGTQFDSGTFADFDCLACHDSKHFVPATFDAQAHARTDFPLADSHAEPGCADCHLVSAEQPLGEVDFGAVARDCEECHEDVHAGLFVEARVELSAEPGCAECHRSTHFADVDAQAFEHELWTRFTLDGAHLLAACEACHERSAAPDSSGRRFGRVSQLFGEPVDACATCHTNVHVGQMADTSADCASCHGTTRFDELDRELFEHGDQTGFELVGAHQRASCEVCHEPRAAADQAGRRFGLVTEHFGAKFEACSDCHDDPHQGRFDGLQGPRSVDGRHGCARCHDQESFIDGAREHFDHELWTSFALEEGHAELSCEQCHTSPTTHSLGRTLGSNCAACHDDAHFGQFGTRQENRCERCHESTASFAELIFDHQLDSRFLLDPDHAELECAACHKPWPLSDGGEAVRYKPLGLDCVDCHLEEVPR